MRWLAAWTFLAVFSGGCCGFPGNACAPSGPPPPDSCQNPSPGAPATVEIGDASDSFNAYQDGNAPEIIRGGQGATMMGIRLRLVGGTVPACLLQQTVYANGADGGSHAQVKTYLESDGSFTTKPLWIPGEFEAQFDVVATIGSVVTRVHLGNQSSDGL